MMYIQSQLGQRLAQTKIQEAQSEGQRALARRAALNGRSVSDRVRAGGPRGAAGRLAALGR